MIACLSSEDNELQSGNSSLTHAPGGLGGSWSANRPWTGDDIINMLLDRDECAVHICKKLYKWFLYDHVDLDFIDGMADILRSNNYEIKPALEYLFFKRIFL